MRLNTLLEYSIDGLVLYDTSTLELPSYITPHSHLKLGKSSLSGKCSSIAFLPQELHIIVLYDIFITPNHFAWLSLDFISFNSLRSNWFMVNLLNNEAPHHSRAV